LALSDAGVRASDGLGHAGIRRTCHNSGKSATRYLSFHGPSYEALIDAIFRMLARLHDVEGAPRHRHVSLASQGAPLAKSGATSKSLQMRDSWPNSSFDGVKLFTKV